MKKEIFIDSVLEKFSIFDFFNLIFTGIIFLISLHFVGIRLFDWISLSFYDSIFVTMILNKYTIEGDGIITFMMFVYFVFLLAILYVIGSIIQELGSFAQNKISKIQYRAISSVLNNESILKNKIKREICSKEARELFKTKNIKLKKDEFTSEHCHYFYTYCLYYIQIREQHKKLEKMRGLQGISNMLSTNFGISAFGGIITYLFQAHLANTSYIQKIDFKTFAVIIITYISLSIIFWFRMKKQILYRIRMVLNTYEANVVRESRL